MGQDIRRLAKLHVADGEDCVACPAHGNKSGCAVGGGECQFTTRSWPTAETERGQFRRAVRAIATR